MSLADDPDETIDCPPGMCRGCGADLAGAPVTAQRPDCHITPLTLGE